MDISSVNECLGVGEVIPCKANIIFLSQYMFLDAMASPRTYPCQSVGQSVSQSDIVSDLEIDIASPSFAILYLSEYSQTILYSMSMCRAAPW